MTILNTVTEKIKKHKCNKETGFCDPLLDRLEVNGYRGKGFSRVLIVTREDLYKAVCEPAVVGIKYTIGAKDRGLMLNYCPFCGTELDWFRKTEKRPEENF
ncbi:MAG: hypothetical protein WDA74_06195 [Spirochaetota bacterium]